MHLVEGVKEGEREREVTLKGARRKRERASERKSEREKGANWRAFQRRLGQRECGAEERRDCRDREGIPQQRGARVERVTGGAAVVLVHALILGGAQL